MIKIIVCNKRKDFLQSVFGKIRMLLGKLGIQFDLSVVADISRLEQSTNDSLYAYDIIMLDSSDETHLDFAEKLRKRNFFVSLVFFLDPMVRTDVLRYRPTALINNIENTKSLLYALKNCINEQHYARPYFTVKNRDLLERINYNDIIYFESRKRIIVMYTTNEIIEFYGKLSDISEQLPEDIFVRCHRSFLVNLDRMYKLDKIRRCFVTDRRQSVDISRVYFPQMLKAFSER